MSVKCWAVSHKIILFLACPHQMIPLFRISIPTAPYFRSPWVGGRGLFWAFVPSTFWSEQFGPCQTLIENPCYILWLYVAAPVSLALYSYWIICLLSLRAIPSPLHKVTASFQLINSSTIPPTPYKATCNHPSPNIPHHFTSQSKKDLIFPGQSYNYSSPLYSSPSHTTLTTPTPPP